MKWLGRIVLSVVIFILLLVVAIYLPPVQQWLKGLAEEYLSKETGMEVKIEKVRLSPWLDLEVDNMSAVDKGDTVVAARELLLDIKVLPLFKGQVDLNGFELREAKLNTKDFISDTHVEGQFRLLKMDIPAVCDLKQKHIDVNRVRLKGADMRIVLSDTAAVDTTPSEPVEWRLALGELKVEDTKFDLSLKSRVESQESRVEGPLQEYMHLKGDVNNLSLKQADIDLKDEEYKAGEIILNAKNVGYDVPYEKPVKGLDTSHLFMPELNLNARDFSFGKDGIDMNLERLNLKEKSGLELTNMSGALHYDSTLVSLSNGHIETPNSKLDADVQIGDDDRMHIKVKGDVGKKDIMLLGGDALGDLGKQLPDKPVNINMRAEGTMDDLDIDYCHLNIPGNMEMRLSGRLNQISSDRRRNGRLHYDISLKDASFLRRMMPKDLQSTLRIPNGTRIGGDVDFRGSQFNLNKNTIYSGKGSLSFTGKFDANSMAYNGRLIARQFPFQNFLPGSGLNTMSGEFNISGKGTDFLSSGTTLNIDANLGNFSYGGLPLDNIRLKAQLNGNNAEGTINADNSWLKANLDFTASQQDGRLSGSLDGSIYRLSLKPFGIGQDDMYYMADVHLKGFYEEKNQKMALGGTIDDLNAVDSRLGYPGGAINFGLGTSPDSTHIFLNSGDMTLRARAEEPFAQLISDLANVADELSTKISAAQLDHNALRQMLPEMRLHLNAGSDNPLQQILLMNGYSFDTLRADITTSIATGINADVKMNNVRTGALLLEDSRLAIVQDSDALRFNAYIENTSKKNPNRFKAALDGSLLSDGLQVMANFKDDKGREGINIGTRVKLDGMGGMSFTLIPEVSTLAYRHFKVNPDNYLRVDSAGYLYANIDLLADDQTNIKLFSIAQDDSLNHEPNQDITLSLANINLHDISNVVPFIPSMSGWLDGDIHIIKNPQSFTAVGQLQSRKLNYDGLYIGELGTELFYMPEEDGHYVVAQILSDDKEVAVFDGHYYERQGGTLDASLDLNRFPTMLLNTFLSDDGTIALQGWADGEITVKGPTDQLTFNGLLKPDSIHVYSDLYGFDLAMENKDIAINNGKIIFDQMKFLGRQSQNPLFIDGNVDFGDLSNIIYDLTIKAKDFELINAERTK
ncbi:MAG: hypothetical protein J5593_06245, partial [Bacteroidaceae bacterium]|nr:hypothetical protein [Bacteroidaceae bacterium]